MERSDEYGLDHAGADPTDDFEIKRPFLPTKDRGWNVRLIHVIERTSDELVRLFDLLSDAGFFVSPFSNPFDAIEDIARNHPEVVVSDAHFCDMEGPELLARIKRASPSTRVILTSWRTDLPVYQEAVEAAGGTLIHEPFDPKALLGAIERTLGCTRKHRG
jgi:DNA-binding NtrC family response regulator